MADDYKNEIFLALGKSHIYNTLVKKCAEKDSDVITLVGRAVYYAFERTKSIIKHMGEFTLHDGDHLFRVLHLMEKLLPAETIENLSPPELMLLILSAFFHDIGMSPDEKDVLTWRKIWDTSPSFASEGEKEVFDEFRRFYSARPDQQDIIRGLVAQGRNSDADIQKAYVITEYIRQTHAERAREIIKKDWNGKIAFRDTNLTAQFAQICFSHNEDASTLLDLDKDYLCATDVVACLPLVGIILRLADILDFDGKRTPSILFSHLHIRHPVSLKEWSKHRAINAWEIGPERIRFSATCKHPAIEASIKEFCNMIDRELSVCNNIMSTLNEFNSKSGRDIIIKFPYKVDREKIRTETDIDGKPIYLYRDTSFNLSKRQVIDLLMGTKLYGNPEIALRELLQNSVDACLLRAAEEKEWGNPYDPEISILYYKDGEETILEIDDNGTGMDEYIIDNYYTKIGSSFYTSADFYDLKASSNADFTPTSRFGIGILSCFMIADTLTVDTKRVYEAHESSPALNIRVEGQDSIFWIREGKRKIPGTTTKLILRKAANPWDEMSEEDFIESVENVNPNPPFRINIQTQSHIKTRDQTSFENVNSGSLKDHSWILTEFIRTFEIRLDRKDSGIVGSATVAILEKRGLPVRRIELPEKQIEIEGNAYSLKKAIRLSENSFWLSSKTITIDEEANIEEEDSSHELTFSKSKLSLHGIEVPTTLFPRSWEMKKNQVKLAWPMPLLLVVDVCGTRDLDLNSSRTEIIMSEKWLQFEEELAFQICNAVAHELSPKYWKELKDIWKESTSNEVFLSALDRVRKKALPKTE